MLMLFETMSKLCHPTHSSCRRNCCDKSSDRVCTMSDESQWTDFHRVLIELAVRRLKKCRQKVARV